MSYGSGKDYQAALCQGFGGLPCLILILLQRDAVALAVFDTETREYIPRTDNLGKIHHIMHRLAAFQATEEPASAAVEQICTRRAIAES